jgi:membrane protein implicated in regulation of membrane protease activity
MESVVILYVLGMMVFSIFLEYLFGIGTLAAMAGAALFAAGLLLKFALHIPVYLTIAIGYTLVFVAGLTKVIRARKPSQLGNRALWEPTDHRDEERN